MSIENIRAKLEKHKARSLRMLTLAATLFFAGAVFQISADHWPEGIIYFIAASFFVSLEKAYRKRNNETDGSNTEPDTESEEKK